MTQDELRIVGVAGPMWIGMLREREQRILNKMYGEYQNGKTDHLTTIAEFACVRGQISEIENAIRQLQQEKQK